MVHGFLLLLIPMCLAAQQTGDFLWDMDDDGFLLITDYVGTSKDVVIPRTINGILVISIWDDAFAGKELTSVIIPDSIRVIGNRAFWGNFLTNIVIPDSVTTIRDGAFAENSLLTHITIPQSVKSIGSYVFDDTPITNITIGQGVSLGRFTHGRVNFGVMGFDDFSFNEAYLSGGSLAGTYTRQNAESSTWTRSYVPFADY